MSFEQLKANRASSISKLTAAAEKLGGGSKASDDRFWSPTVDKAGNGYAVIRFLPAPANEDLPWVRYWDHGFKGATGRWYIENSLTSLGQDDPVTELNSKLWNSGREEDKEVARQRKRRLHYVSNILVISDPSNPANEGKVFLFKFGKKIFDKANDAMQPAFPDDEPVNPFDFWTGANFKLKIRNVEGYRNYDKSEFDKPSELFNGNEDRLKEIYEKLYPLKDFVDPKNYKTYTELKAKLKQVLGEEVDSEIPSAESAEMPASKIGKSTPAPKAEADEEESPMPSTKSEAKEEEDGEDTLSYFAKLAKG